eukprot:9497019-Pyramimonas_sp.AAC.1
MRDSRTRCFPLGVGNVLAYSRPHWGARWPVGAALGLYWSLCCTIVGAILATVGYRESYLGSSWALRGALGAILCPIVRSNPSPLPTMHVHGMGMGGEHTPPRRGTGAD